MSSSNHKGSALIVTIIITVLITIMMIYLLEKIVPASRDVKGIENTTVAYYQAASGIEEALLSMKGADPSIESSGSAGTSMIGNTYSLQSLTSVMPLDNEGNSEFASSSDLRWNRLGPGEPIQLVYSDGMNPANLILEVRVPNIDRDCSTHFDLDGTDKVILNWILSGSGKVLYSAGGITADMINGIYTTQSNLTGNGECDSDYATKMQLTSPTSYTYIGNGKDENGNILNFSTFYSAMGSGCNNWKCTLKISVVNDLKAGGKKIPYLEYRFSSLNQPMPNQYAIINSDGNAYGFKRHIRKDIRQMTTNEALDFTIFQ